MLQQTFQSLINRILNLNPHYLNYLQEVAGISIIVRLTDFPFHCKFIFHHSYIEVNDHLEDADLVLAGRLIDFIIFAAQKDQRQNLLQAEKISFTGELMVLQKIEKFLSHFNLKLLKLIPIAKIKRFLENQVEYWREERGVLASPVLFEYLQDELLELQQDIDRIEARIHHLEGFC